MLYRKLIEDRLNCDKEVIVIGGRGYTYADLDCMVRRCVNTLLRKGYKKAECGVIFVIPHVFSVVSILTCMYMGIPFVLLDEKAGSAKTDHILEECRAKLFFGRNGIEKKVNCRDGIVITPDLDTAATRGKRRPVEKEQIGYILYTSGSTGQPRGVMAGMQRIWFCIERIQRRIHNEESDRILSVLPLTFDYGLYQIFLSLCSGARLYWEPDCLLQQIPSMLVRYKITGFPVVPTLFHLLWKTRMLEKISLPDLRYVCATGERWNVSVIREFHKRFPHIEILPMYGLTECKRVSIMPRGRFDKVLEGSCGLPLDDVEVALENVDPATGCGELLVTGDNVMDGYFRHEEESAGVFRVRDGKRTLYTGDLFRIDKEGFLFFADRLNGIIKRRGIRISSREVEQYFEMCDAFLEVCAVGIEDDLEGEKIAAALYVKSENAERQYYEILKTMPELLRPSLVKFYSRPLPKNENGKLDRREIKNLLREENGS